MKKFSINTTLKYNLNSKNIIIKKNKHFQLIVANQKIYY